MTTLRYIKPNVKPRLLIFQPSVEVMDGKARAKTKLAEKYFTTLYMDDIELAEDSSLTELYGYYKRNVDSRKHTHYLLTINPYPDTCWKMFNISLCKCLNKKWIKPVILCKEGTFNSKEEDTKHPHVHLLIKKNKRKSEVIREVYNTFKDLTGSVDAIDVRSVPQKDVQKVTTYIEKGSDFIRFEETHPELELDEN